MPQEKLEPGEVYTGPAGALRESNWLTHDLLNPEKDTIIQIKDVVRRKAVKFKDETKKGYGSLRFFKTDRELGLNSTHIRVLSHLFGTKVGDWFGRYVALYVDDNVSAFGKIVSAVRIRPKRIEPPKAGTEAANPIQEPATAAAEPGANG